MPLRQIRKKNKKEIKKARITLAFSFNLFDSKGV